MLAVLSLLAAPSWLTTAIYVIAFLCACAIVYWFLGQVKLPEPANYVVYAAIAILALLALVWLVGRFT